MRVVIDTNVWISHIISGLLGLLFDVIANPEITIIFSKSLESELFKVVARPKFSKIVSDRTVQELKNIINNFCEIIIVQSKVNICRDPKDNFILSLAKDAHADYLITGDNDLLVLEKFDSTIIIKPSDFKEILSSFQNKN